MGHHVNLKIQLPVAVGGMLIAITNDAGIRAEQIDATKGLQGRLSQRLHLRLNADIGRLNQHLDLVLLRLAHTGRHGFQRRGLCRQIGQHNGRRLLSGETLRQCRANPAGRTRDDNDLVS